MGSHLSKQLSAKLIYHFYIEPIIIQNKFKKEKKKLRLKCKLRVRQKSRKACTFDQKKDNRFTRGVHTHPYFTKFRNPNLLLIPTPTALS